MLKHYAHADDYNFKQKMENLLLYRKVVNVSGDDRDATLTLDNGIVLEIQGNRGCGGCGNGWYDLVALNKCDNVITKVEETSDGETYHLFVYAEDNRINLVQYEGWDNGYYGQGYDVYVVVSDDKSKNINNRGVTKC